MLKKNESKVVEFDLTGEELGYYDPSGKFMVEPGEYEVMVGTSSVGVIRGSFKLDEESRVKPLVAVTAD
jgi:beta-glucosidase